MARLFLTPREIDFISDITKELTKDVRGQKIFYYGVREDLTDVHDVYEESPEKVFNPPVEIEAAVDWRQSEVETNRFGYDEMSDITVFIHARDLLDRDLNVNVGDYFSYGIKFYEVTSVINEKQVYGQIEHKVGKQIFGKQARQGLINKIANGPTREEFVDAGAVQTEFEQQRGFETNSQGPTGDVHQLVKDGKLDPPLSGPHKVTKQGDEITSSFYGDE
jgi:hypothetical protein